MRRYQHWSFIAAGLRSGGGVRYVVGLGVVGPVKEAVRDSVRAGADENMGGRFTQPTFWNGGRLGGADTNLGGSLTQPTFRKVGCLGSTEEKLGGGQFHTAYFSERRTFRRRQQKIEV